MPATTATPPGQRTLDSAFPIHGQRVELRQDELDAWDRDGFHIHPEPLFTAAECAAIREACEHVAHHRYATGVAPDNRFWEPGAAPTAVCKIDNAWRSDPVTAAAACSPRVGRIAAQLIGADGMRLWHDQYLRKPAAGGGIVQWHQDWMYWQAIDRCRTVTCWIALADVDESMGPMVFLAGSHRDGLRMDLQPTDWTGDSLPPCPIGDHWRRVPVAVRAGQVSFHHGATMHASDANHSPRTRWSLVSHQMASDCCFRPGQAHIAIDGMQRQPGGAAPGERFRGPQFPWTWRAG